MWTGIERRQDKQGMSTKTNSRIKAAAARRVNPPVSREEAELWVGRAADLKHEEAELKAAMDAEVTAVRHRYEQQLTSVASEMEEVRLGLEAWADGHRAEFGERRSLEMLHGVVGWRLASPSLHPRKGFTLAAVLERLRTLGRTDLIRTKEEVNKEAILAVRETENLAALYVEVRQEDGFYVEPKMTKVEAREVAP